MTKKASGNSVREIQASFDKQADVSYISSIKGGDLVIDKTDAALMFLSITKRDSIGRVSLLLEYEGSTAKANPVLIES